MPIFSFSGTRPANLGIKNSQLAPCPSPPNCVSSDAADGVHRVGAFPLALAADQAWPAVRQIVAKQQRTRVIKETDEYLYAECRSAFFGFVDDLELNLRPQQNLIAVRSAARLGYSDFGINRRRIESLRELLREQGVIR